MTGIDTLGTAEVKINREGEELPSSAASYLRLHTLSKLISFLVLITIGFSLVAFLFICTFENVFVVLCCCCKLTVFPADN